MKRLIFILLSISLFTVFQASAQYKVTAADLAMLEGDYELALKLFQEQNAVRDNLLNMAVIYAQRGDVDSAFFYLNKQETLFKLPTNILFLPGYKPLYGDKRWQIIATRLEQEYFKKNQSLNKELVKKLWEMNVDDQIHREYSDFYKKKYGENSSELDSIKKMQNHLDSINLIKLEAIIKEYGWPKKSMVGDGMIASTAFLIIQHTKDINVQKKYLPIIEKMVKIGEIDAGSFAFLTDRILLKEKKKQKYGTQVVTNKDTGKDEIYPIEDEANVDKRRAEYGLEPLKEYLQWFDIEYENK